MPIQHNLLLRPVRIHIHHPPPLKGRIRIMNNAVVVRTQNHLIACIIVQTLDEIIDMMRLRNLRPELLPNQLPANLAAVAI